MKKKSFPNPGSENANPFFIVPKKMNCTQMYVNYFFYLIIGQSSSPLSIILTISLFTVAFTIAIFIRVNHHHHCQSSSPYLCSPIAFTIAIFITVDHHHHIFIHRRFYHCHLHNGQSSSPLSIILTISLFTIAFTIAIFIATTAIQSTPFCHWLLFHHCHLCRKI